MTFIAKLSQEVPVTDALTRLEDAYFDEIKACHFSNSVVALHSRSLPSVRVKLFNKGSVQLTGCKSHVEAMYTLTELCRVLREHYEVPFKVTHMDLVLVNVNVSMDIGINLANFATSVISHGLIPERPERPPSCIVQSNSTKPGSRTTTLVYTTGKFVICAITPQDVTNAYAFVMSILDTVSNGVVVESVAKNRMPRRQRTHVTWLEFIRIGMPGLMHTHNPTTTLVPHCPYCSRNGNVFIEGQRGCAGS